MSFSHDYWGHDTLTNISVDFGRVAWARWGLMDHSGPYFQLDYLGYSSRRYAYLPPDLLELLYERFRQANPSGVTLSAGDLFEDGLKDRYTEQEQEDMYDQRIALFHINMEKSEEGYPYVRPYLPELFEPLTLQRLAADPWLDLQLLEWAEFLGPDREGIRPDLWVDRSARWSPEWRAFCDKLAPLDWSPMNSWKESALHPRSKFYRYRNEKAAYQPKP